MTALPFRVEVVGLLFLGEVGPLFVDDRDQVVMTVGAEDVLGCWSLAPCLLEREHLNYRFK